MENLVNFLEAWGGGWHSTSTGGDFNPIVNGEYTVMGGKKVNVDTDRLVGKPEKHNKNIFAIKPPTDDDVLNFDGPMPSMNERQIMSRIAADQPFFVMGHAGWGKTSIISNIARKYRKTVIIVNLDHLLPEDLGGIPISVKDEETGRHYQEILLPTWAQHMYDNPQDDFLLFFDEMNLASNEVLGALMPIILDKRICGIEFKNFMVGAAGNYRSESDCVHDLPSPIISRVAPIIVWNDEDEESWEEAMRWLKNKWSGKLDGKADDVLEVIDKYKMFFKNPREIDHKVFEWMNNIINKAQSMNIPMDKYKHMIDKNLIEDMICTLFVKDTDVDNLRALKKEIMSNADRKRAVQNITNTIYDALYDTAINSSSQKQSDKLSTMSNEGLQNYLRYARIGFLTRKNSKDTIIISRDNFCDIFPLTKQQQDQIEMAMGDVTSKTDGYKWQTEKDAKKENPKWLTYEEACKKYPDMK